MLSLVLGGGLGLDDFFGGSQDRFDGFCSLVVFRVSREEVVGPDLIGSGDQRGADVLYGRLVKRTRSRGKVVMVS